MDDEDDDGAADSWVVVKDPSTGKNVAIVGMHGDDGVVGIIPLFDPRDADQDGKVSAGEWLASKMPIVGPQSVTTARGALLRIVALDPQVYDEKIFIAGTKTIIKGAFVAVEEAIKSQYLDKLGAAAGEVVAVSKGLEGAASFLVKQSFGFLFKKMMRRAVEIGEGS